MDVTIIYQPALLNRDSIVLRLDGVPTPLEVGMTGEGFFLDSMGSWRSLTGDGLHEVESECVNLHDELAAENFRELKLLL